MSLEGYKNAKETWIEKRGYLECELAKSDSAQKFNLRQQIKECIVEIQRLGALIADLEKSNEGSFLESFPGELPLNAAIDISETQVSNKAVISTGHQVKKLPEYLIRQGAAHLIVAVFYGANEQDILVQAERCYIHPERQELVREPVLDEDDYQIKLSELSKRLKTWVIGFDNRLENVYQNVDEQWQLTIDLLVPTELLSGALMQCCGKGSTLPLNYAVIVRCSDRFNDQIENKAYLYNQLKGGRKRVKQKLTDIDTCMTHLDWLCPNCGCNEDLEDYAALQCLGDWLKPGQDNLDNWAAIIKSGIPIAIWMCEKQEDHQAVINTYHTLAQSTRVNFLKRIRKERNHPKGLTVREKGYHLGIFYEHDHSFFEPTKPSFFAHPQQSPS